jgi:taurine dioxygenase
MAVEFKSLQGPFGVELLDVDFSKDRSDKTLREVVSLLYKHQFIVIRNQRLQLEQFDAVTRTFGAQRPHFLDHLRMEGHASILMLSNVFDSGRQIGVYEGACFWHTDVAYEDPPNSATIVYSIRAPHGAPTYLADMFTAYDALPENTKKAIENLTAIHHYGNREDTVEGSPTAAERLTDDQKKRVNAVFHPLVMRHPATGRRSLYGVCGSSFGIVDMPDAEAIGLLRELANHATQPEFTTAYDYEVGDVAAWDTYSTLHKAPFVKPADMGAPHARILWRVSVTGLSPLVAPHVDRRSAPAHRVAQG